MSATIVQHNETGLASTNSLAVTISAPTAGNTLIAYANADTTMATPTGITGWTAGPSVIDGNGAYIWWKVAQAGDGTTVNFPTSGGGTSHVCGGVVEVSGTLSVSPFDKSNSSTISASAGTTTSAASITNTGANGDFVFAMAALHGLSVAIPSSPSWTNSYVQLATCGTTGFTSADCRTFVATLDQSVAAATSTVCSWTQSCIDRQGLIISFFEAGGGPTPPTPKFVCGAECGLAAAGTASAGTEHWSSVTNFTTVVTSGPATMRSTRCYRIANSASSGGLVHGFATAIASPATMVWRFYVYFGSLPGADTDISRDGGSTHGVYFKASDSTIRAGTNTFAFGATGVTVTTGQWYRIDAKVVLNTTTTVDVQVDGVACGQYSVAGSANSISTLQVGNHGVVLNNTYYIDDIIVSGTSTDYPIGAGTVFGAYPISDKTNNAANPSVGNNGHFFSATTDFAKGTSGATATGAQNAESTSWQSLDNPLTTAAGGSWIADLLGASGEQLCWNYDLIPSTATTVNGVMVVITTHSASTTANLMTVGLTNAGSSRLTIVNSVDLSEATITVPCGIAATPAGGGTWTVANIRDGSNWVYFTCDDVNPDVYLDGVCLEIDYVPLTVANPPKIDAYRQLMNH